MEFGGVISGTEIWDKLTALAAAGDCRAMKLYYELLEKKQKANAKDAPDMMQMAAIRRAVFGSDAVKPPGAETAPEDGVTPGDAEESADREDDGADCV